MRGLFLPSSPFSLLDSGIDKREPEVAARAYGEGQRKKKAEMICVGFHLVHVLPRVGDVSRFMDLSGSGEQNEILSFQLASLDPFRVPFLFPFLFPFLLTHRPIYSPCHLRRRMLMLLLDDISGLSCVEDMAVFTFLPL